MALLRSSFVLVAGEGQPGSVLHYMEAGDARNPAVVLCHGWPESWYSWRKQIGVIAAAGFHVLAIDQRGYGKSHKPQAVEAYALQRIVEEDIIGGLLDSLSIQKAIFIGHDWGGALVWYIAHHFPERTLAVGSLNTPFAPADPTKNPWEGFVLMKQLDQEAKRLRDSGDTKTALSLYKTPFNYQLYFQDEGVAESEFEADVERTMSIVLRGVGDALPNQRECNTTNVTWRGGFLVGLPEKPSRPLILSEEDLAFYSAEFRRSGFRGPLNWYRNVERNWIWNCKVAGRKIEMPALMVTAGKDFVLTPSMSKNMEKHIPNLSRSHIENCSHWTMQDCPQEVNQILVFWLTQIVLANQPTNPAIPYSSSSAPPKL